MNKLHFVYAFSEHEYISKLHNAEKALAEDNCVISGISHSATKTVYSCVIWYWEPIKPKQ